MREFIKYFAVIAAVVVCSSCSSDVKGTIYDDYISKVGVSFPSTQCTLEMQASDNGVLNVPVYRGNSSGDAKVNVSLDASTAAGLFTLVSPSVEFKSGESLSYVKIKYDLLKVDPMSNYVMTISFADAKQLSPSAISTFKLTTKRKLTWKSVGMGTYFDAVSETENQKKIEKAEEGNIYRIVDAIVPTYSISFALSEDGKNVVSYPTQPTGFKMSLGILNYKFVSATVVGKRIDFVVDGVFGTTVKYQGLTEYVILP